MSFKCSLCEQDIQPGESMVSDEKMCLAHESCVKRGKTIDPPTVIDVKVEPCVMPSRVSFCAECQKPGISRCPACLALVHQSYGHDGGPACSVLHEAKCEGARLSRVIVKKEVVEGKPTNGVHHAKPSGKKRARK